MFDIKSRVRLSRDYYLSYNGSSILLEADTKVTVEAFLTTHSIMYWVSLPDGTQVVVPSDYLTR